jgi:hypothetical protein
MLHHITLELGVLSQESVMFIRGISLLLIQLGQLGIEANILSAWSVLLD